MGFIKAFTGGLSASFANQWLEYMAPPATMTDHVLLARAVTVKKQGSENNDGEEDVKVISDGSKFLVPENTCLILVKNGAIEGVVAEPGGFTYTTQDVPEAKSMFAGDGFFASTFGASFNQFKYGGQPGNQQVAFYVNLKDIMGLSYGTQNPIRYKDANYGNAMLAVTSFGNFSIKVVDPVLMFKNLIPTDITSGQGRAQFELGEGDGGVEESLFSGFVGSLAVALSSFTKGGKSIDDIQGGTTVFAAEMNKAIEETYQWGTKYGIAIVDVQPRGLDWDEKSLELIDKFNQGFLMQGSVGAAYAQTQVAEGINAAGQQGGGGMMGMGVGMMGAGMVPGMMGGMQNGMGAGVNPVLQQQQMQQAQPQQPAQPAQPQETPPQEAGQAPADGANPAQ